MFIDSGGNGEVWEAENDEGRSAALKVLYSFGGDAYERFKREVEIVQGLDPKENGILPILDSGVPAQPSRRTPPWYVMPLATGISDALREASLSERVAAVGEIARTLAALAPRLHHRDVKPSNLYQHDGRFVIGDFGLAKRPEDVDLTGDRPLGPWFHLPSEVFVRDDKLDWEKVDVHCLANTLWQLASERPSPPRGSISAGGEYDLARYMHESSAGQLSALIAGATNENPAARPTLAGFAQQLSDWLEGHHAGDDLMIAAQRMRRVRHDVLRHLVALVRREPFFVNWQMKNDVDPSGIGELTNGEATLAIDELYDRGQVDASDRKAFGHGRVIWTGLYPTLGGIAEVEDIDVVLAQAAPLLRVILEEPRQMLTLSRNVENVEIGRVIIPPAEAFFLLRVLEDAGLVSFRTQPGGGGGLLLLDLRATSQGRDWLVERYASRG